LPGFTANQVKRWPLATGALCSILSGNGPRVLAALERYRKVAERHGLPLVHVALAFAKSRFFVASTIIGATSLAQLDDLAKAFELVLAPEVLAEVEAVNADFPSPAVQ
jgi:aryl-alcohol dehydrogenase-like predicted oxidoreductase